MRPPGLRVEIAVLEERLGRDTPAREQVGNLLDDASATEGDLGTRDLHLLLAGSLGARSPQVHSYGSLTEIVAALDAFFEVPGSGADPAFSERTGDLPDRPPPAP